MVQLLSPVVNAQDPGGIVPGAAAELDEAELQPNNNAPKVHNNAEAITTRFTTRTRL